MKKFIWVFMLLISAASFGEDDFFQTVRTNYKYDFAQQRVRDPNIIALGDRVEADVLLEVAALGFENYTSFAKKEKLDYVGTDEVILIMPRIDYLEKYIDALSKKSENIYLFIMEGDKLPNEYGDRSYETFIAKGLDKKMPKNVKVFKLKNDSVAATGDKNNYEMTNIQNSVVFRKQIIPMYNSVAKFKFVER